MSTIYYTIQILQQLCTRIINNVIIKQPDNRFLYIFSCMTNVFLVLYKMELITRYPLEEFSYKNLDMLANQHDACEKIIEMLDELFNLVSGDLKWQILLFPQIKNIIAHKPLIQPIMQRRTETRPKDLKLRPIGWAYHAALYIPDELMHYIFWWKRCGNFREI